MVTIVLTACPAGLRGHLTRWMTEVSAGVFVGRINARLRDSLWAIVCEEIKSGRAIMTYTSSSKEQGFEFRVHRHDWEVVDHDGLELMRRPARGGDEPTSSLRRGWSKAYQRRRASRS